MGSNLAVAHPVATGAPSERVPLPLPQGEGQSYFNNNAIVAKNPFASALPGRGTAGR